MKKEIKINDVHRLVPQWRSKKLEILKLDSWRSHFGLFAREYQIIFFLEKHFKIMCFRRFGLNNKRNGIIPGLIDL